MTVTRVQVELVLTPDNPPPVGQDRVRATFEHDDGLGVELEMMLAGDELVPVALTVRREPRIDAAEVRVPLQSYLTMVTSHPALTLRGERRRTRRRRVLDDDFLRSVADAYQSTGSIAGIDAQVNPLFSATARQKHRWVEVARERGFLPPRGDR
jgi:hypothetical protein